MNKQKVEVVENLEISNGGALKRFGALFIDLGLGVLILFLLSFLTTAILDKTSDYTQKRQSETRETKRSFLVTLGTDLTIADREDIAKLDAAEITQNSVPFYKYAEATYHFYTIYLESINPNSDSPFDDDWFLENVFQVGTQSSPLKWSDLLHEDDEEPAGKKYESLPTSETIENESETPLFDPFLVPGTTYKVAEPNPDVLNAFYKEKYVAAIKIFEARPEYREILNLVMIDNVIRIVVSSSLLLLAVPLFAKNGQTLGKMAFKLGVTTTHGYKVHPLQLLLRYFVFLVFNLLSNLWLPVVFPFISLTLLVFNKRGKTVHDFAANTRVVDLNKTKIYDSPQAMLDAHKGQVTALREQSNNDEVFAERFREDSGA